MTTRNERLLQWLSDAHSMEMEAESMLKAQVARIENYPDLRQRIEQHVTETQGQARRLESCIERLGGSTSGVKDTFAKMMAGMHASGNAMLSDEVVKASGLSYAFEHLEIATYRALIVAARAAGDEQTAQACDEILREEQAMADWLEQHIDATTLQFLQRDEAEVEAKR